MRIGAPFVLLCILMMSGSCRQKIKQGALYAEADSLIQLTMALQERLGSPEIQRIHDFENEILADLERLADLEEDTLLRAYKELRVGLGQCLQACSEFHEEAFLLETTLREIMNQCQTEGADLKSLRDLLAFEQQVYEDLSHRIDSSYESAMEQARRYYVLKPMVDQFDTLQ